MRQIILNQLSYTTHPHITLYYIIRTVQQQKNCGKIMIIFWCWLYNIRVRVFQQYFWQVVGGFKGQGVALPSGSLTVLSPVKGISHILPVTPTQHHPPTPPHKHVHRENLIFPSSSRVIFQKLKIQFFFFFGICAWISVSNSTSIQQNCSKILSLPPLSLHHQKDNRKKNQQHTFAMLYFTCSAWKKRRLELYFPTVLPTTHPDPTPAI